MHEKWQMATDFDEHFFALWQGNSVIVFGEVVHFLIVYLD